MRGIAQGKFLGYALAHAHRQLLDVLAQGERSVEALAERGWQVFSLEGGMQAWSLAWNTADVPLADQSFRVLQLRRTGKECLSYLIGIESEATMIDASLDPQVYLDLAAHHGWQITRILDTHSHADHLSRSRLLAERSGAALFLPAQQRVQFPFATIRNGETLATAGLRLTAQHG